MPSERIRLSELGNVLDISFWMQRSSRMPLRTFELIHVRSVTQQNGDVRDGWQRYSMSDDAVED